MKNKILIVAMILGLITISLTGLMEQNYQLYNIQSSDYGIIRQNLWSEQNGGDTTVSVVMEGFINEGETKTATFITKNTTGEVTFDVYTREVDRVYLHVYDVEGNHVGYNAETGEDEINISNSSYTGHNSLQQIITINQPIGAQEYIVKLEGIDINEGGDFGVSAIEIEELPAEINFLSMNTYYLGQPGESLNESLVINEINGQKTAENIELIVTDLINNSNVIPSTQISFNKTGEDIPAGEMIWVHLTIEIPLDTKPGVYKGTVTANASNSVSDEIDISLEVPDNIGRDGQTPGFELIIVIFAMALILFLKQKRSR